MNRRILIQVTAPVVLIGLVLTGACLVSAWYVNRLQAGITNILAQNVSSMEAAQQLEISARQLRFHCFLYLIDPAPDLGEEIRQDQARFDEWLEQAERVGDTTEERRLLQSVKEGYDLYWGEFERLRQEAIRKGPRRDFRSLADTHALRHVVDPCREYLRVNEDMIARSSQENSRISQRIHLTMLLLALGGPLGGLLSGFGIARGLSQSLYRLSVRVQDMTQHLDRDVAAVNLIPEGDLGRLDQQLAYAVGRVAEVAERLQRHQRETLRAQQLAAVGQLAASVAHEVRNPLTSIKLLVEAGLRDHKPKPLSQENLKVIHTEVLRLEQSVQGFLDFARPPVLQRRAEDLRAVVAQAVELVRARARQQRVQLQVRGPDEPVTACVDRGQLCSVLVNLFVNALDAMPQGGCLEVCLEAASWNSVGLTVSDTGSGIAAEVAEQLFVPFVSTKPTGSGLGLSISKRIIEEHGGQLAAANRPEGGACFTLLLPAPATEQHDAAAIGHR